MSTMSRPYNPRLVCANHAQRRGDSWEVLVEASDHHDELFIVNGRPAPEGVGPFPSGGRLIATEPVYSKGAGEWLLIYWYEAAS